MSEPPDRKRRASAELDEASQPPKTVAKLSDAETPPTAADAARHFALIQKYFENADQSQEIAQLQKAVEDLVGKLQAAEKAVEWFKGQNHERNGEIGDQQVQIERLKQQIKDQKTLLETKDTEISRLEKSKRGLRTRLENKIDEAEQAQKDAKSAHDMLQANKNQLRIKVQEAEQHKQKVKTADEMLQGTEKQLRDTEHRLVIKSAEAEKHEKSATAANGLLAISDTALEQEKERRLAEKPEYEALLQAAKVTVNGNILGLWSNLEKLGETVRKAEARNN